MTAIPLETTNGSLSTFDAAHLPDTVRGPVNVATEMAHLVTGTAGDLIAKEVDLLRIEGDEIAKSTAAVGRSGEPTAALQDYCRHAHQRRKRTLRPARYSGPDARLCLGPVRTLSRFDQHRRRQRPANSSLIQQPEPGAFAMEINDLLVTVGAGPSCRP